VASEDRREIESEDAAPVPESGIASPVEKPALSAKGAARRRFTRVGTGAAGVLLTLHSQPGMACTYCGIAPSAALSAVGQHKTIGTLSHGGKTSNVCRGILPSDWCSKYTTWPTAIRRTDLFSKYFDCTSKPNYKGVTCQQILEGHWCDSGTKMGQYMMAAYLNVVDKRVNFLTLANLKEVWLPWSRNGYYEAAGERWLAGDIVAYLYGTMD